MFNQDFYPTKRETGLRMIHGLNLKGKNVLEPEAGKGDLIDLLKEHGANVICCELNKDLALISSRKATLIANDFFSVTKEQVSHVDYIIANPPFSSAAAHIHRMWEIAPDGCEIITLCNNETYRNHYSRTRESLKYIVDQFGTYQNLGNVFSDAERTTDVEVGLIHLYKPKAKGFQLASKYTSDFKKKGTGVEIF